MWAMYAEATSRTVKEVAIQSNEMLVSLSSSQQINLDKNQLHFILELESQKKMV